ncbi:MAG: sigma-E processing peptidase SpoIIGA, partial [Bacilli bacterium]
MKVYIDLVLILNFFFDFLLLLSVSLILRRNVSIYKIMLGAFIGGLSLLFLFIKINSITLFILKILISIIMLLVSFGYKSLKYTVKNGLFFYTSSIILGGFLYFLNIQFSYKNNGLVFINKGLSINVVFLIIFCPIIIYIYIKQGLTLKNN